MREIFISKSPRRIRLAEREDGRLSFFDFDVDYRPGLIGNIYLARVRKKISAGYFVNIAGTENAFLPHSPDLNLQEGEALCVQVTQDAWQDKVPQVSNRINLAGHSLSLGEGSGDLRLSRQIKEQDRAETLRSLLTGQVAENCCLTIRTAAVKNSDQAILREAEDLLATWQDIHRRAATDRPPALLYSAPRLTWRYIRDLRPEQLDAIHLDDLGLYNELKERAEKYAPGFTALLQHDRSAVDLFADSGLEEQIAGTLDDRVEVSDGLSLVIQKTEALTVVDVNFSASRTHKDPERQYLEANLTAARELARQINLRGLGGLFVIDFLRLRKPASQARLQEDFRQNLSACGLKIRLTGPTTLGLFELSVQRRRADLAERLLRADALAPLNLQSQADDILAQLARTARSQPAPLLQLHCSPDLFALFSQFPTSGPQSLFELVGVPVKLVENSGYENHQFLITAGE